MEPLVSVIVPVYRTEAYLDECMRSVLGQTYQNLQIILVDDGSPDNCPALCDGYVTADSRVTVIHRENGGLSAARNSGKAAAKGQYLTFLDSDDILAPQAIECMVAHARREQAQIVKIGIIRTYKTEDCVPVEKGYEVISGYQAIERIYRDGPQMVSCCGKLYAAELFADYDFPVGLYYEDEYSTPRLYNKADKVVLCGSLLYFYMQRENESIIRGALNEKRVHDSAFVTRDRIEFFRQAGLGSLVNKAAQDHYHKLCHLIQATAQNPELAQQHTQLLEEKKKFVKEHPFVTAGVRLYQLLAAAKRRVCGPKSGNR